MNLVNLQKRKMDKRYCIVCFVSAVQIDPIVSFWRQSQAYKYPIVQEYRDFPSTLYPLRVDHMLRSAHSVPVVDLLTALPCSNGRVELLNMQPGNRVNCGISSFVPSSFCGSTR